MKTLANLSPLDPGYIICGTGLILFIFDVCWLELHRWCIRIDSSPFLILLHFWCWRHQTETNSRETTKLYLVWCTLLKLRSTGGFPDRLLWWRSWKDFLGAKQGKEGRKQLGPQQKVRSLCHDFSKTPDNLAGRPFWDALPVLK